MARRRRSSRSGRTTQQNRLGRCARSCKGKSAGAFRSCVRSCLKK